MSWFVWLGALPLLIPLVVVAVLLGWVLSNNCQALRDRCRERRQLQQPDA